MKKMNKTYEAPVAEVIEMQMPVVLTMSTLNEAGSTYQPDGPDPFGD